jgi:hypothetical protein
VATETFEYHGKKQEAGDGRTMGAEWGSVNPPP